jgi:predicted component of type VI protein secretion system
LPSFYRPTRYENEESTRASFLEATLPFRAFAGAVAHELDRRGREIGGGLSPDEVSDKVREFMLAMLAPMEDQSPEPESVTVEVEVSPDEPGLLDVTVRLQPNFQIYGAPVDLIVGTTIPR